MCSYVDRISKLHGIPRSPTGADLNDARCHPEVSQMANRVTFQDAYFAISLIMSLIELAV